MKPAATSAESSHRPPVELLSFYSNRRRPLRQARRRCCWAPSVPTLRKAIRKCGMVHAVLRCRSPPDREPPFMLDGKGWQAHVNHQAEFPKLGRAFRGPAPSILWGVRVFGAQNSYCARCAARHPSSKCPLVELARNKSRTASVQCFRPAGRRRSPGREGVECTVAQTAVVRPKDQRTATTSTPIYRGGGCHPLVLREANSMLRDLNKCPG